MKKLKLKKEIIANLTQKEQNTIKGGGSFFLTCNTILVVCKTVIKGPGLPDPPHPSGGAAGACSEIKCPA